MRENFCSYLEKFSISNDRHPKSGKLMGVGRGYDGEAYKSNQFLVLYLVVFYKFSKFKKSFQNIEKIRQNQKLLFSQIKDR